MHEPARRFVAAHVVGRKWGRVVEVGALDVNGGVRDLIDCNVYVGVDKQAGHGVDVVADALCLAEHNVDLVICCEVLEHEREWAALVARAFGWLAPGGRLVVTCATDPRAPHGCGGGDVGGEWYGNVDTVRFAFVAESNRPARLLLEVDRSVGDLRAVIDKAV